MMPLAAATKIRKLDPQDALWQFITGVAQPHAPAVEMVITREKSFVNQALRKYKNLRSPVNIQFYSAGRVEPGFDAGGPTRDFFYHLMQELVTGSVNGIKLFEGEMGHLTLSFDYDLVSSCLFIMVGKMILHSILHECRGISGISPAVVNYILR